MRAGPLLALAVLAAPGTAGAEGPSPGTRLQDGGAGDADRRGALLLGIAGTAGYGRRSAGVGGGAALGLRAGAETWLLAEAGVSVGQMIGEPGNRMFHSECLGLRDGAVFLGAEHRGARGRPYRYWGWLAGVHLPFDDAQLVGLAFRAGVGFSTDTRSVDWNLGAALEFDIPIL